MSRVLELHCHPETSCTADIAIAVAVERRVGGVLALDYRVTGELAGVLWPTPLVSSRTDGLWQATCFEAFVAGAGGGYTELNFSPSGAWAAYEFDAYREGMRDAAFTPRSFFSSDHREARLVADVALGEGGDWRVGISAVIEAVDGSKSYWALRHPVGKPDFHHADCFALSLAAGEGA